MAAYNKRLLAVVPMIAFALYLMATRVPTTSDACPQFHPTTTLTVQGEQLIVEVAASHSAHRCGLAKREQLAEGHAMLFVYQDDRIRRFWMKDTVIPLSLAFIGSDMRIQQIVRMQPQTPNRRYLSRRPARYALETKQGWFASHGIVAGDAVGFAFADKN